MVKITQKQEKRKMDNENKGIWLGLDISTTTIGCALIIDDGSQYGKLIELTHISPKVPNKVKGVESLFLKKEIFENEFIEKYKMLPIEHVVIESPLLRSNNANTCSTLLMFNGMISECIYRAFGVVPEYISSYEAREYSFPELMTVRKFNKQDEQYTSQKILKDIRNGNFVLFGNYPWTIEKKGVIHGKVSEIFPQVEWLYDKRGELKKENFDSTDAYVALLGFLNKKRYGELKFTSEIIGESNDGNGTRTVEYDVHYWDRTERRKTFINEEKKENDPGDKA